MRHYAVTAIGLDGPGLLASVSGVLGALGWNIVGSLSTVFHGFALSAFFVATEGAVGDDVKARVIREIRQAAPDILQVDMSDGLPRPVAPLPAPAGPWWMLWCNSDDAPGVLSRVAGFLAGRRGSSGQPVPTNIVEHYGGVNTTGRCVMHFMLALHREDDPKVFSEEFSTWAEQNGVVVLDPVLTKGEKPPFLG